MDVVENNEKPFPKGFLWGASTSAHQIEGNNTHSDWWKWEYSQERVAKLQRNGLDPADFQSGSAVEHYTRYADDLRFLKELHLNAYRFSIEWARIEPREGEFNDDALAHYANVIDELHRLGIEPLVTLHHQTNPAWFTEKYNWDDKKAPELFARYAEKVAGALGQKVKYWLTINEPKLLVLRLGPARITNPVRIVRALKHLVEAHRLGYEALKKANPASQISLAYNFQAWTSTKFLSLDQVIIRFARVLDHGWFLGNIKDHLDFIGINYYRTYHFGFKRAIPGFRQRGSGVLSDMEWEIYPEGLYYILKHLSTEYGLPLLVTENGIADSDDTRRSWFIKEHVNSLHRAIADGVDVFGYCHWSLLDNFEWDSGFGPRFGLIAVNYETQERQIRDSARFYADIAKHNRLLVP